MDERKTVTDTYLFFSLLLYLICSQLTFQFLYQVRRLIRHREAAVVIEYAYSEIANKRQRVALVSEFYGPNFSLFEVLLLWFRSRVLCLNASICYIERPKDFGGSHKGTTWSKRIYCESHERGCLRCGRQTHPQSFHCSSAPSWLPTVWPILISSPPPHQSK